MYNYNMYFDSDNYLISYHIEDNKILKKYDRDTTLHPIPISKHNIEVCERQLQKELNEVPKIIQSEIKNLTLCSCALLPLTVGLGITGHYVFTTIDTIFLLRNMAFLYLNFSLLKNARLSIFCLENIDKIKEITANQLHHHLPLQKKSLEILDSEEGLTYNNINQCIHADLKILKKTINDYYGEKK